MAILVSAGCVCTILFSHLIPLNFFKSQFYLLTAPPQMFPENCGCLDQPGWHLWGHPGMVLLHCLLGFQIPLDKASGNRTGESFLSFISSHG